jgi:hypothetical protein
VATRIEDYGQIGNLPQAITRLALITSARILDVAARREVQILGRGLGEVIRH